jgi:hypothetical protein
MRGSWTHADWLLAFQKIQSTPEAGRLAYEAARCAAEGTPLPNWEIKTDYYHYLLAGRRPLTKEELVICVTQALSRNLPVSFILEHAPSFLQ